MEFKKLCKCGNEVTLKDKRNKDGLQKWCNECVNEKRKAKYLPSPEDKLFKSKLYFNPIIQSLETSKKFSLKADKLDFKATASKDFATQIYNEFQKEESYLNYLKVENTNEEHLDMILELFRFCRKRDGFLQQA